MTDTLKRLDDGQNIKADRQKFSTPMIIFQDFNFWDPNVMHFKVVLFLQCSITCS